MKKLYIKDYVSRISKQQLIETYTKNSVSDCARAFHVDVHVIKELLIYYDIEQISQKQRFNDAKHWGKYYEDLCNKYPKAYVETLYNQYSLAEISELLNISQITLKKLLQLHGISEKSREQAYSDRSMKLAKIKFDQVRSAIDRDELESVYSKNNIFETCKYFKTSQKTIYKLLELYNIEKRSAADRVNQLRLDNIEDYIDVSKFKELYYKEKSLKLLTEVFHLSRSKIQKCIQMLGLPELSNEQIKAAAMIKRSEKAYANLPRDIIRDLYENKKLAKSVICKQLHISPKYLNLVIQEMQLTRPTGLFPNMRDSAPNLQFEMLLKDANLNYVKEFSIQTSTRSSYRYDFKVNNFLIEINPSATHNCTIGVRGGQAPIKSVDYHQKKSQVAYANGYICIHVWDWSDQNLLVKKLLNNTLKQDICFAEPRRFVYNLKLKKLVTDFTANCVEIYDDGSNIQI